MNNDQSLPQVHTSPVSIGKFIEEICQDGNPTHIVACYSRAHFLRQLKNFSRPESNVEDKEQSIHPPESQIEMDVDNIEEQSHFTTQASKINDQLLTPTLKLLAASSHIRLAFCPTIPIFRAYLAALPIRVYGQILGEDKLIILGAVALHYATSEFTVQGLSRTFALISSVNAEWRGKVDVFESVDNASNGDSGSASVSWNTEVPLLSGSIKIGDAGQEWASRTTTISKFAKRWFQIE